MAYISEVASIYIQRFYTGWITLRNQLATPIRIMGRRVIELYDALISGNDWEVTPFLSLKRRAGHTAYATLNYPALNMVSWKSNTQGTIPVIDTSDVAGMTGADIEYIAPGASSGTALVTKTNFTQCGMMGIGNFFYMGNTVPNLKWDGPSGKQGVTNWGVAIPQTAYGPTTATTGANSGGVGIAWTNPSDVTGSSGFAAVTTTNAQVNSQTLYAGGFSFSVPSGSTISGVQVTFTGTNQPASGSFYMAASLYAQGSSIATAKIVPMASSPTNITLGGPTDLWGSVPITTSQVNATDFKIGFAILGGTNEFSA